MTESESGVLPLHYTSITNFFALCAEKKCIHNFSVHNNYNQKKKFVKYNFKERCFIYCFYANFIV